MYRCYASDPWELPRPEGSGAGEQQRLRASYTASAMIAWQLINLAPPDRLRAARVVAANRALAHHQTGLWLAPQLVRSWRFLCFQSF